MPPAWKVAPLPPTPEERKQYDGWLKECETLYDEVLKVPLVGEEDEGSPNQVPRSQLIKIIKPRLDETFELVREKLDSQAFSAVAGRRVVLTGGASQMQGIRDLASAKLDRPVRLGRPLGIQGLPEANAGPASSTCAGLLHYAMTNHVETPARRTVRTAPPSLADNPLGRLSGWLRKNF